MAKCFDFTNIADEFKNDYIEVLNSRLGLASLNVEGEPSDEYTDAVQTMKMIAQLEALNYAKSNINVENKELFTYNKFDFLRLVVSIARILSNDEITDFRKGSASVVGSNVKRSDACMIPSDLINIIDNYNWQKKKLEKDILDHKYSQDEIEHQIFLIEAQLHRDFLKVHPFGDYNGRTSRILLTVNLIKAHYAPPIITKTTKKEYNSYIENNDIEGLANLFERLSNEENETLKKLYLNYLGRENTKVLKLTRDAM